ncbi:chymotrypsin family serine protease [Aeromicrobium massiliense]|uniref:hypothetical protein n=1 Tax=Aeromicrobium massiliense TaxID=1464554 RepID=UPI00067640DF|nr:hypothetical protein [Aeromicrobium massiliense]
MPVGIVKVGSRRFAVEANGDRIPIQTEAESLRQDATLVAEAEGMSVAEATEQLELQDQLAPLGGKIRDLLGDRVVHVGIVYEPVYELEVRIADGPRADDVETLAEESGLPVSVRYTSEPTEAGLVQARERFEPDWRTEFPAIVNVDVETEFSRYNFDLSDASDKVRAQITEVVKRDVPRANVSFTEGAVTQDRASRGGLPLVLQANNAPECTSGFMATKNSTGTKVLLTAGHCRENLAYRSYQSANITDLNFGEQANNARTDVQYHYTGGVGSPLFVAADRTSYRTVKGLEKRTDLNGARICHQGMTTNYSCGNVTTITSKLDGCGANQALVCDPVWVVAKGPDLKCDRGDSGGPVFVNTRAAGLLAVSSFYQNGDCAAIGFASRSYFDSQLDVTIMTE